MSRPPILTVVRPYSLPPGAEFDGVTGMLLAVIRLIRLGHSHDVIVREVFGDEPHERLAGRRAIRKLRVLGFSVQAERSGKTTFSRKLMALNRRMAGRPESEFDLAREKLLAADEPKLARMLAKHRWSLYS